MKPVLKLKVLIDKSPVKFQNKHFQTDYYPIYDDYFGMY